MTKRLIAALVLAFVIVPSAHADFAAVAKALDAQKGVDRVWIPFLGLARFVVRVASPKGVHDFQLVTFSGADRLEARAVNQMMRDKLGVGFSPLVRARSKNGEWSFIYARPKPDGKRFELIVLTHDREDTVLVRVEVDAEVLSREIDEHPRNAARMASSR
jgi:hypothetical protein